MSLMAIASAMYCRPGALLGAYRKVSPCSMFPSHTVALEKLQLSSWATMGYTGNIPLTEKTRLGPPISIPLWFSNISLQLANDLAGKPHKLRMCALAMDSNPEIPRVRRVLEIFIIIKFSLLFDRGLYNLKCSQTSLIH